jgi:peptidoglycan/xylan/chitin deacetylase (PgdA/CDA1 family)
VVRPILCAPNVNGRQIHGTAIEGQWRSALGARPAHLSYPYGDAGSAGAREFAIAAELGFKTAVTTRPGVLFRSHAKHLTALPRISLNGEYQQLRYVRVLLSGSATAIWNGFRRAEAA